MTMQEESMKLEVLSQIMHLNLSFFGDSMELKKRRIICLIGLIAVIALFILFSVSFKSPGSCDSSPQYFIQIENMSEDEFMNSSPDSIRDNLTREGFRIIILDDSVFSRNPSIRQGFEFPKNQVFINTSDVKLLSDFSRDAVFFYNNGYYMLNIGHYDRAGCGFFE